MRQNGQRARAVDVIKIDRQRSAPGPTMRPLHSSRQIIMLDGAPRAAVKQAARYHRNGIAGVLSTGQRAMWLRLISEDRPLALDAARGVARGQRVDFGHR